MNDVSSIICPAVVITEVESSSIHKYNKTCRRTLKNCIMKKKQIDYEVWQKYFLTIPNGRFN